MFKAWPAGNDIQELKLKRRRQKEDNKEKSLMSHERGHGS
jgi:hypothetical protein